MKTGIRAFHRRGAQIALPGSLWSEVRLAQPAIGAPRPADQPAAVDRNIRAGDRRGVVGGEKGDSPGNLVGLHQALQGGAAGQEFGVPLAAVLALLVSATPAFFTPIPRVAQR